jgi:hypothetical protein
MIFQIRRMVEKERDVLEIIDDEPGDDRVEEPDSQGQISTPPQPQPKSHQNLIQKRELRRNLLTTADQKEKGVVRTRSRLGWKAYLRAQMSATSLGGKLSPLG